MRRSAVQFRMTPPSIQSLFLISLDLISRLLGRKYLRTIPIPRCLRRDSLFQEKLRGIQQFCHHVPDGFAAKVHAADNSLLINQQVGRDTVYPELHCQFVFPFFSVIMV